MKTLQVIESAYRATVEEQDDTIVWLTHAMRAANGTLDVLLVRNAVSYAVRGQRAPELTIGGWRQSWDKLAQLVSLLPDELRADVLTRMARLDEISPEVIAQISALIEQRLRTLGGQREQHGGVRGVAELFNRLDRSLSQSVLESIETESPDLAVSIRNLMFVFDDLRHLENTGLREVIARSDKKLLTIALKGASEDIRNRFFENMSKRAADLVREELEVLGAVRLREVEKAQQEIVAVARKLEEEGVIVTGAAAGDAYVV